MASGDPRSPPGRLDRRRGELRVLAADGRGRRVSAPGVTRWLARVAPAGVAGTVSLALVTDAAARALNRDFRGIDSATDVLSFPDEPSGAASVDSRPGTASRRTSRFLGDIVIARGVARRQARAAGHSELTELRVLALHGLLHLLGYDHERDHGRMQRLERRLRRKGGLREGLIERTE
jgi:probable rRNA maturation factor